MHDQGIAAFSNPDEGEEYLLHFNPVLSGLRKKGAGLTDEESDALRNAMVDEAISPAFIRRSGGNMELNHSRRLLWFAMRRWNWLWNSSCAGTKGTFTASAIQASHWCRAGSKPGFVRRARGRSRGEDDTINPCMYRAGVRVGFWWAVIDPFDQLTGASDRRAGVLPSLQVVRVLD
jgi:hypothetical protein